MRGGGGVDLTSPRRHARSVVAARCFTLGRLARAQFGTHPGVASGHARAWEDRRLLRSVVAGGHCEEQRLSTWPDLFVGHLRPMGLAVAPKSPPSVHRSPASPTDVATSV